MRNDFVLDAFGIFEEERVIARGLVFWIFAWRRDDDCPDAFELRMKSVDFGSGSRSEGEMVERAWLAPVNRFILEGASGGGDGEGDSRVAVFDNVKVVRLYGRTRSAVGAEAEQRKQPIEPPRILCRTFG